MGKTISITIPNQLEKKIQMSADKAGISRSRYIGNLLLQWGERQDTISTCKYRNDKDEMCLTSYKDVCTTSIMETCRMRIT